MITDANKCSNGRTNGFLWPNKTGKARNEPLTIHSQRQLYNNSGKAKRTGGGESGQKQERRDERGKSCTFEVIQSN